jgi:GT2 family glycosyltransferase
LVNHDGSPQHCAQAIPSVSLTLLEASRVHKLLPRATRARLLLGPYFTYDVEQRLGWTWGTALMGRREAVAEVGPLCEQFFLYGEDLEWCLRMKSAGWEVWFCHRAEVTHHGAASAPIDQSERQRRALIQERIFDALACHRSRGRMAGLHAANVLAAGGEWLAARLRRRPVGLAEESIRYHVKAIAGALSPSGRS